MSAHSSFLVRRRSETPDVLEFELRAHKNVTTGSYYYAYMDEPTIMKIRLRN